VVVQGHLLHLCHQALFTIHCDHEHKSHKNDTCQKINELPKSFNTEKHLHWIFVVYNWRAHYCVQLFKFHLVSEPCFYGECGWHPLKNTKLMQLPVIDWLHQFFISM
jgi:hypothetical protein